MKKVKWLLLVLISVLAYSCGKDKGGNGDKELSLSLSPETLTFVSADETKTVSVTTDATVTWAAKSSEEWCVLTGGSGTGNGEFTVTLNTETLNDQTTAKITVTSPEIAGKEFSVEVKMDFPDQPELGYIFDDFEGHTDFTINSPGTVGWSYIDGDGLETYGFESGSFPNAGAPMAFIVFNPSAVGNFDYVPHSGNRHLACFASVDGPNNDWLISPELNYSEQFKIAFWAQEFTDEYGHERFRVVYSTSGNAQADFSNSLTPGSYVEPPLTWTRYEYDVPANAKYVAINCVSNDAFIFFVDDVAIGIGELPNRTREYQAPAQSNNSAALPKAFKKSLK